MKKMRHKYAIAYCDKGSNAKWQDTICTYNQIESFGRHEVQKLLKD